MNEYDKQAADLLQEFGVAFEARYVGNACPPFCKDREDMSEAGKFPRKTHIHGDQHLCTLSRPGKIAAFDFWNSYRDQEIAYHLGIHVRGGFLRGIWWDAPWADRKKHRTEFDLLRAAVAWKKKTGFSPLPTAYDLLACLQKYDPGTFRDFCSEFSYSDDSIRALETYRAVQDEFEKVRRFFTSSELERLQEIA